MKKYIFFLIGLYAVTLHAQTDSTYYVMGQKAFYSQDYKSAIELFSKDIALNPKRSTSYYARGLCNKFLNKHSDAIKDFNTIIKMDSTYSEAYNELGNISEEKKDFSKAMQYYNKAISYDSTAPEYYNNRANTYMDLKNNQEAEKGYLQAIRLKPTALYYKNLGELYYKTKQYQKVVDCATKAIAMDPEYKDAYSLRSGAYVYLDNFDKADEDSKKAKAIKKKPAKLCDCPAPDSSR